MGDFRLGKIALGNHDVSTGQKMQLGKLPNCIYGVHINAPTGNTMVLHDANRGSSFNGDAGLTGYPYRAVVSYNASVGGAAGYQFLLKVYYAKDALHGGDAGNVNGTEALDGEPVPIAKVYLNQLCKWDFSDVRCALVGSTSAYTYRLIEKVDGVYALFLFQMAENPDTARLIAVYWGLQTAVSASSDSAAEAIISGGALNLPLDEAAAETINVSVIVDSNPASFWSIFHSGTGSYDLNIANSTEHPPTNSAELKMTVIAGAYGNVGIIHTYGTNQNWSTKSKTKFLWYGINNGTTIYFDVLAPDGTNMFRYSFVDNFVGYKLFDVPFSSFTIAASASWTTVNSIRFFWTATSTTTKYCSRCVTDTGITANDRSSNGNNATATGATVGTTAPKYAAKPYRIFNGIGDYLSLTSTLQLAGEFTVIIWLYRTSKTAISGVLGGSDGANKIDLNSTTDTGIIRIVNSGTADAPTISGLNVWQMLTIARDSGNITYFALNDAALYQLASGAQRAGTFQFSKIGLDEASHYMAGYLATVIVFNKKLSDTEKNAIYNNYPDQRRISGTTICRKWASTTLPTVNSVSDMQVRNAYAVQDLYPAIHNTNPTLDKANKKFTQEFYISNTQRESSTANTIYIGGSAGYWNAWHYGTGSYDVTVTIETDRHKLAVISGAYQAVGMIHTYLTAQDFTPYDFVALEVEGTNSGQTWLLAFKDAAYAITSWTYVDNFIGRKVFMIPVKTLTQSIMAAVKEVDYSLSPTTVGVISYMRRLALDNGVWAYVEVGVPDKLQSFEKIYMYSWNGTAYVGGGSGQQINWDYSSGLGVFENRSVYFLNGIQQYVIQGSSNAYKGGTLYGKGKRSESKASKTTYWSDASAGNIIYSRAKTRYRIGFAIKMPPSDLATSATTGIGQCKLKLEIYYT